MIKRVLTLVLAALVATPAMAISTKSLNDGLTALEVAQTLAGSGAQISNVTITGSPLQIGKFEGGAGIGLASGIILSSGDVADAVGPNNSSGKGKSLGGAGYADLDKIVAPRTTRDAAILEFDVLTSSPLISIKYVFASEEYLEYVNSAYNDVFAFFVGGANIAIAPGTKDPVTINSINPQKNGSIYKDNKSAGIDIQYDGFTAVLTAVSPVTPGVPTHIRIAIADVSDGILDSAVMIAQGGISGGTSSPVVLPDVPWVIAGYDGPVEVPLSVYYATLETPLNLSLAGDPLELPFQATFRPLYVNEAGQLKSTMYLQVDSKLLPGNHQATIRSESEGAESFASVEVIVDCAPPSILGIGQPMSAVVPTGSRARLSVTPEGSRPYSIQWYMGYPGMLFNPVPGGTLPQVDTAPVYESTPYYARIQNPCGTVDSAPAFVSPN